MLDSKSFESWHGIEGADTTVRMLLIVTIDASDDRLCNHAFLNDSCLITSPCACPTATESLVLRDEVLDLRLESLQSHPLCLRLDLNFLVQKVEQGLDRL